MILDCPGGPNVITKAPIKGRQEGQGQQKRGDDESRGQRVRGRLGDAPLLALNLKRGALRQGMNAGGSTRRTRQGNGFSPRLQEECSSLANPFRTSEPQNRRKISLQCFKPQSL